MDRLESLLTQIDDATARLTATVARLDDERLRQASLLPGWSRGHVLTHLARAFEAHRNLLEAAATGRDIPAYGSQEARDRAIEDGSNRPVAEQLSDIERTAAAFRVAVDAMPDEAWGRKVTILHLPPFPAGQVVLRRLVETELHHVDLDAGYGVADWPATFRPRELPEPMRGQAADRISWATAR